MHNDLSVRDKMILDLERSWFKYAGAKEETIRELFSMTSTRYYQALNTLIDQPAALAHDPMTVRRLRRLRDRRKTQRIVARRPATSL